MKGFSKATFRHMNGFPKAVEVNDFSLIFKTIFCGFPKTAYVAISGFKKPLLDSTRDVRNPQPLGSELESRQIRKQSAKSVKVFMEVQRKILIIFKAN